MSELIQEQIPPPVKIKKETETEPIKTLEVDGHKITILGTAHISQTSADKVKELIATGEFDAVAVELCPSRHKAIVNPDLLSKMDLFQVIKKGQASMVAASLALGAFQQRMAERLGVEPGAEMRTAIKDATEAKLPILLIDREIGTTLKRIYHNVPWWRRIELYSGLLASIITRETVSAEEIERLKEGDVLESAFSQFAENEKHLYQPLISERDEYMSARLLKECMENNYEHTLAVVGAGHLKGIEQIMMNGRINDPDVTIQQLDTIPESTNWFKFLPWVIVAMVLTGFTIGFMRSHEIGMAMIIDWILINGGLAALGATIVLAHPLTILTAFLAAPITSLDPTTGVGMFTALVEAYLRKPTVGDFSRLRSDTASLKGWWHNRVTRILLIFLFSSLGSIIGTYIAGYKIVELIIGS
ncbi:MULTISPECIES: TraB/GumN family protein [Nitrosomonas]|uniref:Pheromone shutdown-related protein TraB n=1 Tax=Nitrosomonas communis TaxID=44574 RepID=A0A0F7KEE9_9PROT|nr:MULTISPECIES: TraB/GumN family protein [Nitrosomonas]AKH37217.1 TraB family protein [Nitrosomonas communis]TYP74930.1 pheromone shutdown-related protein TraB [Nitrosomonas communis]UVS62410.1 TraB/GumN family protein [Nitrosomonas sp. PLL12]